MNGLLDIFSQGLSDYWSDVRGGSLNPETKPYWDWRDSNANALFEPIIDDNGNVSINDDQWAMAEGFFNPAAPVIGLIGSTARGLSKGSKASKKFIDYPPVGAPIEKVKENGSGTFLSKGNPTPEQKDVDKLRKQAMKDIKDGKAPQYFNLDERYYADPSYYEDGFDTLSLIPKKEDTQQKWLSKYDTPEARQTLLDAFKQGSQDPNAVDWYAMGQLQDAFIKEFGAEQGARLFKERFADAMAATTGGADPTANLLMAHYGNQLKASGAKFPEGSYEMPYPIGGRYATGNMNNFRNNIMTDNPGINPETNPKRYNFSRNFLGDRNRATIDEQMMGAFNTGEGAPTWYGTAEGVVRDLARQEGVPAANFQDAAWAGLKSAKTGGGNVGKPMMSHINDMLYRTSKVTGESMEGVLKRFMNGDGAMYSGLIGAPIGYGVFSQEDNSF